MRSPCMGNYCSQGWRHLYIHHPYSFGQTISQVVLYSRHGNLVKYRHFIYETKFGKGPPECDHQIPIKLPKSFEVTCLQMTLHDYVLSDPLRHANLISVTERISKCINFDAMCKNLNANQDVFSMVTNFLSMYFLQVTVQSLPGPQLLSEKRWELQLHEACKLVPFFKILKYRQLQIEEHLLQPLPFVMFVWEHYH